MSPGGPAKAYDRRGRTVPAVGLPQGRDAAGNPWRTTRTREILVAFQRYGNPDLFALAWGRCRRQSRGVGRTIRKMRPRQRTGMLSPKVISDGILSVSSISDSFGERRIGEEKDSPRTEILRESHALETAVPGWRRESGRRYGNRCPTRRSTRTGGVVIGCPSLRAIAKSAATTLAHAGQEEKFQIGETLKIFQSIICLQLE